MSVKLPANKVRNIAKVFKAMGSLSNRIPLNVGMHVLSDGRVAFVADSRCMDVYPALHIQFLLQPDGDPGPERSAYFYANNLYSALYAEAGESAVFEFMPNGDTKVTIGGSSSVLPRDGVSMAYVLGTEFGGYELGDRKLLSWVPASSLVRALDFAFPAVSSSKHDVGTPKNRILLEFHESGGLRAVSTDGRRLNRADIGKCGSPVPENRTIQAPLGQVRVICAALATISSKTMRLPLLPVRMVQIARYSTQARDVAEFEYAEGELKIFLALEDDGWIRYESISEFFQWGDSDEIMLDKSSMMQMLEFLKAVLVRFRENVLPVHFRSLPDSGTLELVVDCDGSSVSKTISLGHKVPGRSIWMNAQMTRDALVVVDSYTCRLVIKDDDRHPYLFVHQDSHGQYLSLIMPILKERL